MEPRLRTFNESEPMSARPEDRRRTDPRKRPSKSLPTDRMKFDVQARVLQTFGRVSGPGKRAVNAEQLAGAMDGEVSHYTVLLSHNFFLDAGWAERKGRGEYAAAAPLSAYTTRLAADPGNHEKAVESLRASAQAGWFWRAIEDQVRHGAPMAEVMISLMDEAEVGEAHTPQLRNLLEWLRYVGLIAIRDDRVFSAATPSPAPSPRDTTQAAQPAVDPVTAATESESTEPTTNSPEEPGTVLAFNFEFRLTAKDLAVLTPEQIKTVFESAGALMAIKAGVR